MRALPLLALLPILAAPWAPAASQATTGNEEVVELRINDQEEGTTLLVRRDPDGALLVRAEDFGALRLEPPQQAPILVDGAAYFRIDAAMGATVEFDASTQSVKLSLPPDAFLPTVAAQSIETLNPATVTPAPS